MRADEAQEGQNSYHLHLATYTGIIDQKRGLNFDLKIYSGLPPSPPLNARLRTLHIHAWLSTKREYLMRKKSGSTFTDLEI